MDKKYLFSLSLSTDSGVTVSALAISRDSLVEAFLKCIPDPLEEVKGRRDWKVSQLRTFLELMGASAKTLEDGFRRHHSLILNPSIYAQVSWQADWIRFHFEDEHGEENFFFFQEGEHFQYYPIPVGFSLDDEGNIRGSELYYPSGVPEWPYPIRYPEYYRAFGRINFLLLSSNTSALRSLLKCGEPVKTLANQIGSIIDDVQSDMREHLLKTK